MLSDPNVPTSAEDGGPNGEPFLDRKPKALAYREEEAKRAAGRDPEPVKNRNNGEEWELRDPRTGFPTFAANSTKGMPHNGIGEVIGRGWVLSPVPNEPAPFPNEEAPAMENPTGPFEPVGGDPEPVELAREFTAYDALLRAVRTELPADFAAIPIGPNPTLQGPVEQIPRPTRPFVDPQNGLGFALEGPDAPSAVTYRGTLDEKKQILLAPKFSDPELAADGGEVYLMALLRDVPFNQLQGSTATDTRVTDAVRLINQFSKYRGPVNAVTGKVTPQELFRGGSILAENGPSSQNVGELDGPYLSQFMVIGSRVDDGTPPPQLSAGDVGKAPESVGTGITLTRAGGEVLYGTLTINQKQFEVQPGLDFVTDYTTWLQILQGVFPKDLPRAVDRATQFTSERKFRYSLRQFAEYVHFDQTYQEGLIAALLILSMGERVDRLKAEGRNPPSLFNPGNVYLNVPNQTGFGSFGNGHVLALLAEATTRAVKAAWAQKWFNQRRLRPEVLAGRVHNTIIGNATPERYRINAELTGVPFPVISGPNDPVTDTAPGEELMQWVAEHNRKQNEANGRPTKDSYLLPQQYPEGSPTHPSYPAGHATQIGAEVTVLKGLFNEAFPITDDLDPALVPNADGSALVPFTPLGQPQIKLTLGGELNKLAANVSLARSLAGVHYRLDYSESVLLGEYVGLGILQEQAMSFNQARRPAVSSTDGPFFFELTLFSGIKVRVLSSGKIVRV